MSYFIYLFYLLYYGVIGPWRYVSQRVKRWRMYSCTDSALKKSFYYLLLLYNFTKPWNDTFRTLWQVEQSIGGKYVNQRGWNWIHDQILHLDASKMKDYFLTSFEKNSTKYAAKCNPDGRHSYGQCIVRIAAIQATTTTVLYSTPIL